MSKEKTFGRKEFIAAFAKRNEISKEMAREIVVSVFELISDIFDDMENQEKFVIKGFGTFQKKTFPAHMAPKFRGEDGMYDIPERSRITFKRTKSNTYSTNGEYDEDDTVEEDGEEA